MTKKRVTVLDIGSSKVTVLLGERGVNNSLMIHNYLEVKYVGYDEDGFLPPVDDVPDIKLALYRAIDSILENSNIKLDEVFIGVPGNFLKITTKRHVYSFAKNKVVTKDDVEKFKQTGYNDVKIDGYQQIMASVLCYNFADGRVVDNPIGLKSANLNGILSYSLCQNYFKQEIDKILMQKYKFTKIRYCSSVLCQSLFLVEKEKRDNYAVLLDVGGFESTLSVCYKNGVVYEKTFPLGGAYITEKIMSNVSMPEEYEYFELAESFKRKANLSLNSNKSYEIVIGNSEIKYPFDTINSLIKSTIADIAAEVASCFEVCAKWLPQNVRIHLTGGGIAMIRGSAEYLRDMLDRGVDLIYPEMPLFKKPIYSSALALLDYAVNFTEKGEL